MEKRLYAVRNTSPVSCFIFFSLLVCPFAAIGWLEKMCEYFHVIWAIMRSKDQEKLINFERAAEDMLLISVGLKSGHTATARLQVQSLYRTRSIWKMLGPFATTSRLAPIQQMSLAVLSRAAWASMSTTTSTTTTRDRGDRYGPMEWAQLGYVLVCGCTDWYNGHRSRPFSAIMLLANDHT